jgi:hypothetical protein
MPTLVESVVYNQNTLSVISAEARDQLLTSLVLLRKGRRLSAESVRLLTEWGVFSPNKYALDIGDHEVARKELTSTEIHTTLRIELDVLGGSSLWSADYASTEGSPVVVSMTKNLAILLAVDPNKTIRRDGLWVEK